MIVQRIAGVRVHGLVRETIGEQFVGPLLEHRQQRVQVGSTGLCLRDRVDPKRLPVVVADEAVGIRGLSFRMDGLAHHEIGRRIEDQPVDHRDPLGLGPLDRPVELEASLLMLRQFGGIGAACGTATTSVDPRVVGGGRDAGARSRVPDSHPGNDRGADDRLRLGRTLPRPPRLAGRARTIDPHRRHRQRIVCPHADVAIFARTPRRKGRPSASSTSSDSVFVSVDCSSFNMTLSLPPTCSLVVDRKPFFAWSGGLHDGHMTILSRSHDPRRRVEHVHGRHELRVVRRPRFLPQRASLARDRHDIIRPRGVRVGPNVVCATETGPQPTCSRLCGFTIRPRRAAWSCTRY